jgi:hypothetical protein
MAMGYVYVLQVNPTPLVPMGGIEEGGTTRRN